jgi:hypothetical protein
MDVRLLGWFSNDGLGQHLEQKKLQFSKKFINITAVPGWRFSFVALRYDA